MIIENVGELKKLLADIPDDTPVAQYRENMETSGYFNNCYINIRKATKVKKHTYDRFDGTDYSYEVFERDENGKDVLCLG